MSPAGLRDQFQARDQEFPVGDAQGGRLDGGGVGETAERPSAGRFGRVNVGAAECGLSAADRPPGAGG